LGETRDDAAGEAFDKTAKLMGLPYPGGKHIEALARDGEPGRFKFTKPMLKSGQLPGDADYYDVSFSGLKTAVLLAVRASDDLERDRPHIARGFQDALIGTLVAKTVRAARAHGRTRIVLGGGVACNRTLADAMTTAARPLGGQVFAPTPRLATDNAAMIAAAGLFHFERGQRDGPALNAHSALPIPGLVASAATAG
jgi:N6-L-threonylcarbamoyladenine synthase